MGAGQSCQIFQRLEGRGRWGQASKQPRVQQALGGRTETQTGNRNLFPSPTGRESGVPRERELAGRGGWMEKKQWGAHK